MRCIRTYSSTQVKVSEDHQEKCSCHKHCYPIVTVYNLSLIYPIKETHILSFRFSHQEAYQRDLNYPLMLSFVFQKIELHLFGLHSSLVRIKQSLLRFVRFLGKYRTIRSSRNQSNVIQTIEPTQTFRRYWRLRAINKKVGHCRFFSWHYCSTTSKWLYLWITENDSHLNRNLKGYKLKLLWFLGPLNPVLEFWFSICKDTRSFTDFNNTMIFVDEVIEAEIQIALCENNLAP